MEEMPLENVLRKAEDAVSKSWGEKRVHGSMLPPCQKMAMMKCMTCFPGRVLRSEASATHRQCCCMLLLRAMAKIGASSLHRQLLECFWVSLYTIASLSLSIYAFRYLGQHYNPIISRTPGPSSALVPPIVEQLER